MDKSNMKLKNGNDASEEHVQFQIRPPGEHRFSKELAKEIIDLVLNEELGSKSYSSEDIEKLTSRIAVNVKARIRAKVNPKYKLVCNVVLGEQRGAGVRHIARCLWDSGTDAVASASFENESIFCVATIFAIYFY